jgi:hypothetical protein
MGEAVLASNSILIQSEGDIMAGKIQLKLKPKAPAAAAPAAAPAAGGAAPAFAPAAGKSGGITIELRGTSVHIQQVVVVKR